jgi:hypothetical protein
MGNVHSAVESDLHRPQGIPDWVFRVVLHLNELEKRRGTPQGNWAGFVTETVLPRLGIDRRRGTQQIEWLEREGYVTVAQVPNPKMPARTASFIKLNQRHPKVREVLEYARSLKGGFVPVELAGAGTPGQLVAAERDERGGAWDLLLPRISPVRSSRALIWNAVFFQGSSHLALDLHGEALRKRVEAGFANPRGLALDGPLPSPARPGMRSWYRGRAGEPLVDLAVYDEGIAQCTIDLAYANSRAYSEGRGIPMPPDEVGAIVCGEAIKSLTPRVWRVFQAVCEVPAAVRVKLFFTIRGMKGTRYGYETFSLLQPAAGEVTDSDGRPFSLGEDLRLDLVDVPESGIDACLDRVAEHYGWWSHAEPPPLHV